MRVLVTGGTGFVGSHTVAALAAAGHEVRLLVRSPDRIAPALAPHGISGDVDHRVGDVTDADAVEAALSGCDAVVHAAAVYNLDSRAYRATRATNVAGAQTVLTAAVAHGCDPVIHVSSTVALLRKRATVSPDSPLSRVRTVYVRSKVESEAVARRLQAEGAPVVIVQPGGVLGPHDPHLSDQVSRLREILRGRYPMWPAGGYHAVDVRDVAAVHAAVMRPGAGTSAVPGAGRLPGREDAVRRLAHGDRPEVADGDHARLVDAAGRPARHGRAAGVAVPPARRVRGGGGDRQRHPVRRPPRPGRTRRRTAPVRRDAAGHRPMAA